VSMAELFLNSFPCSHRAWIWPAIRGLFFRPPPCQRRLSTPIYTPSLDWLSRLLIMMPVGGELEIRCSYGAPWRIAYDRAKSGEMPYHVVLSGSAILETPGAAPKRLNAGDIVMLPHGSQHVLHDSNGASPSPARTCTAFNVAVSENGGTGDRLDMLGGHFLVAPPHDRLMRNYLPATLVVRASVHDNESQPSASWVQLTTLVGLMQAESASNTPLHAMKVSHN
jgi:AraC family transcriptional regulator, activator of mtrCDE